jgi:hypothetical protein
MGDPALGDTRTLASPNCIAFDTARGYGPVPAKLFGAEPLASKAVGRAVHGWTCPINVVARHGSKFSRGWKSCNNKLLLGGKEILIIKGG